MQSRVLELGGLSLFEPDDLSDAPATYRISNRMDPNLDRIERFLRRMLKDRHAQIRVWRNIGGGQSIRVPNSRLGLGC